jgi:hypothetical protein
MHTKFVSALLVLMLTASAVVGQSTFGSIVGVVHHKTQAVVPGASVRLQSLNDNSIHTALSDQDGAFEFVNLKPGRYALFVEAQGFDDFKIHSAELTARQALRWCGRAWHVREELGWCAGRRRPPACEWQPAPLAASFTACQTIFSVMGRSARQPLHCSRKLAAPLALAHMNDHVFAVDIRDLEMAQFSPPQAGFVQRHQHRVMQQVRGGVDEPSHLLLAQYCG